MFYRESRENGDVCVTDVSDTVFKAFLQFFYMSAVELTADHLIGVLHLGHKFNVKLCIDACAKFLETELTNENVCTVAVFASADFLTCSKNVLAYIMKKDLLSCSKVGVF